MQGKPNSKKFSQIVLVGCLILGGILIGDHKCIAQQVFLIEKEPLPNHPLSAPTRADRVGLIPAHPPIEPKQKLLDWHDYPSTWDGKQAAIWSIFALSGTIDGMLQAYHADQTVFEKRWGVSPTSFWGSEQWKRNYRNNDPSQPHKSEILGNVGRDFWHSGNWAFSATFGIGAYAQGARKQHWKYRLANFAGGLIIHSLFSNVVYNTLR